MKEVVDLPEEEYIECIRSTLNSSEVFLERKPKDIHVNLYFLAVPRGCLQFVIVVFPDHTRLLFLYNVTILKGWQANIDIQFFWTHMPVLCTF